MTKNIAVAAALLLLAHLSATAQERELSLKAKNYLRANYPGWTIGESWRGDEPRVPAVEKGDFNGDGKSDLALLINKDERTYAIILLATKTGYKAYNLLALAGSDRWVAGIDARRKGQTLTSIEDMNKKLRLKYDAIFLYDGERMGPTYQWDNGNFKEIEGFE